MVDKARTPAFEGSNGVGSYTVSITIDNVGLALASAGSSGAIYPVFHSQGSEISDVGFTFSGSDDYETRLEWRLIHRGNARGEERILARGIIEKLQQDVRNLVSVDTGTLDYIRSVYLELLPLTSGPNLSKLTSLLFTMTVKEYGGEFPSHA